MARDAIAVLANLYLRFGRADDAATLLGAVAALDEDPAWALRARCIALLRAGRHAEAAAEAERLLDAARDDADRVPLLHALSRACWALGRVEEARAAHLEACGAAAVSVGRADPSGRRP
jgi:predicted Zn-dependent protease